MLWSGVLQLRPCVVPMPSIVNIYLPVSIYLLSLYGYSNGGESFLLHSFRLAWVECGAEMFVSVLCIVI